MKTIHKISILFVLLFAVLDISVLAIPSSFVGTVIIDGQYAAEGLKIEAYINNTKKGESSTKLINGKAFYAVDVTNGNNSDVVNFKINGIFANEHGIYDDNSGVGTLLHLTVTTGSSTNVTTTTIISATTTTTADDDDDDETTTTTTREITVIMPGATTTTIAQTTSFGNLGTTTTVSGAAVTTVSQDANFQPVTTTTEKTNGSKRIVISQRNSQAKSPDVIGSMINFAAGNSITFLLVIGAFLAGYYVQKIRR